MALLRNGGASRLAPAEVIRSLPRVALGAAAFTLRRKEARAATPRILSLFEKVGAAKGHNVPLSQVHDMNDLIHELRTFITENFLFGQTDTNLAADASFLDSGIIDSTGLLELIGFVERTYHIRLADDELVPDNLDSLNKLAHFLGAKLSQSNGQELWVRRFAGSETH